MKNNRSAFKLPRVEIKNDRDEQDPNEQNTNNDGNVISDRKYVELFMSNKLVLPTHPGTEFTFSYEDLKNLGEIGSGRFGVVSKMVHGHEMAVKRVRLISNQFDDRDEEKRTKQLVQEIKIIQEVSLHSEIVKFFGVTFFEGDCLICMEYMDISLDKLYRIVYKLAKQSFNEDVLGTIAVTLLKALNNLKKFNHIIHRDVKPSNILLNREGKVSLCDFGISGYLEDSMVRSKGVGCRPYMSPERLTASIDSYDIRSDVWSLGITLIETALGEFPYKNFGNQAMFAQIQQVVLGDPPMLTIQDNFSPSTIQFINKCLTKEYRDRPTYQDLMQTDFFNHYSQLPNKVEIVAKYVQEMLEVQKQFPDDKSND
ncbi:Dual specificity mitogen-activated protein kinase kinase 2 [Aphelenchoides bicaudatus]|nr:Dual specificity mitogen-activated protein kinase kinase 2 [Aphelenchoides bicaudatus]